MEPYQIIHLKRRDSNKGGITLCIMKYNPHSNNNHIKIGIARCSSKDNFNRKLGVIIATGRAKCPKEQKMVINLGGKYNLKTIITEVINRLQFILPPYEPGYELVIPDIDLHEY